MSKAITAIDEVKKSFQAMVPQFKMALPPHVSPDKFVRTVLTAIQTTPALMKANRQSLYAAAMRAASAGLICDGKEAALVPYGDQVQFLPMIFGILKQVRNSGELASITAQLVHENDKFKYWVNSDGEHVEYEPNLFGDRGKLIGVFALASLKDSAVYIEVMTIAQVETVRAVSKAKNGPAWNGDFYGEMAKKTVLRRLSKRLPISTDKAPALSSEDDQFDFEMAKDATPTETKKKKSSRFQSLVEGQTTEQPVEQELRDEPDLEIVAVDESEPSPDVI